MTLEPSMKPAEFGYRGGVTSSRGSSHSGSRSGRDADELQFHWKHPEKHLCLTLAYSGNSGALLGINTFGMRMRHEVIDQWLTRGLPVDQVVTRLGEANFDPEGYRRYEPSIQQSFFAKTKQPI